MHPHGMPPAQGMSSQGMPPQAMYHQGMPPGQSMPPQGMPPQGMPAPQGMPPSQAMPQQQAMSQPQGMSQAQGMSGQQQQHPQSYPYMPMMGMTRPYGQPMGMPMMQPMMRPDGRSSMGPPGMPAGMPSNLSTPMGMSMPGPMPMTMPPGMSMSMPQALAQSAGMTGNMAPGMPSGMPPGMGPTPGGPGMAMRPMAPVAPMYGGPMGWGGYGLPGMAPMRSTLPAMDIINVPPPQTRQGTSEEIAAFYRRLKTLPPFYASEDQNKVRLNLNVQSAPLDKVAMSRFLFAILRQKRYQTGKANVIKSSLMSRGTQSATYLDTLVPVGLRHAATTRGEVLQNEATLHTEDLTRALRPLPWFTLSPFHPGRAFYNFDRSLGVESHPLSTLLATSADDDYDAPSDPFVRDSGFTYVSRILQRAAVDYGPGYTLRPRMREVTPDILDMVSILCVCMKEYCQALATAAIKCAAEGDDKTDATSKARTLTTTHVLTALQEASNE